MNFWEVHQRWTFGILPKERGCARTNIQKRGTSALKPRLTTTTMRTIFTVFILFMGISSGAQKMLQIERLHSPKTIKFYKGSEITFQEKEGQWYTRVLSDLSYENNWLLFPDGKVDLDDVSAIRSFKNKRWSSSLGNQMILFAPVWAGYNAIAMQVDSEEGFSRGDFWIMGASIGAGLALRTIFRQKTWRFKKKGKDSRKFRLRILDLDIR